MRPKPDAFIEKHRITSGPQASDASFGNNGAFVMRCPATGCELRIIVSDGMGWDHASVSLANRCPTWEEMSWVKQLFWSDEETVVQFHPAKCDYVNYHRFCLHLWRDQQNEMRSPATILVGPKKETAKR